jgi:hypothetical protein
VIWRALSDLLRPLWRAARLPDAPAALPVREAAAYMALESFGAALVRGMASIADGVRTPPPAGVVWVLELRARTAYLYEGALAAP